MGDARGHLVVDVPGGGWGVQDWDGGRGDDLSSNGGWIPTQGGPVLVVRSDREYRFRRDREPPARIRRGGLYDRSEGGGFPVARQCSQRRLRRSAPRGCCDLFPDDHGGNRRIGRSFLDGREWVHARHRRRLRDGPPDPLRPARRGPFPPPS